MKKLLSLVAFMLVFVCLLASCGGGNDNQGNDGENPPVHTHLFGEWEVTKSPTCTEDGIRSRYCSCGEKQTEEVYATGHTVVIDSPIAPTCTESGYTEGKHCSVCYEIIVAQSTIDPKGHTEVIDAAVAATCTTPGLTEGKHCSVCSTVIVAQNVVTQNGHTEVIDPRVEPTCTESGYTEGKHCSVCDTVLVAKIEISKIPHTYTDDYDESCNICGSLRDVACAHTNVKVLPKVDPTCISPGLTEGKECEDCHEVLEPQTSIDATGHIEESIPAVPPTCTTTGLTEGKKCSVCQVDIIVQQKIGKLGHSMRRIQAKPANCTEDGNEAYWTCDRCYKYYSDADGIIEISLESIVIKATGHQYSTEWSTDENYHWQEAVCGHSLVPKKFAHSFEDNLCICGYIKLETPVIREIKYDIIKWYGVENADTYTVVVNDDYELTLRGTSCSLVDVTFNGNPISNYGTVKVKVRANSYIDGDYKYKASDYSDENSEYYYIPNSLSDNIKELDSYRLGYGYNLVEDEYLNVGKASGHSVLNLYKLLTLARYSMSKPSTPQISDYYSYSSIDEYMSQKELSLDFTVDANIAKIGSIKAQMGFVGSEHFSRYAYNEMFVVEASQILENHELLDLNDEELVHCLNADFLKALNREIAKTESMSDDELAEYIYETYGTHIILGVQTGSSYIAQYSISTNNIKTASDVKAHFKLNGSANISKLFDLNVGLDVKESTSTEWKNSETEAHFHVEWYGSTGGAGTNPANLDAMLQAWANNIDPVTVGFTENGAISMSSILRALHRTNLAACFDKYVNERADSSYKALFAQYEKQLTRLINEPSIEDGKTVITIDLNGYQEDASMIDAYDPNFLDGILTIYPIMYGKKIDKIVINGNFDEHQTLIDKFSVELSKSWDRDVEIIINNLGVISTSPKGIIDASQVKGKYKVDINFRGINVVQKTDGTVEIHSALSGNAYSFVLDVKKGENLKLSSAEITIGIRLPELEKTGYDFIGWYDGDNNRVTDAQGYILESYTAKDMLVLLHAEWNLSSFKVELDHQGATSYDGNGYFYVIHNDGAYADFESTIPLFKGNISEPVSVPSRTGFVFGGYYVSVSNNATASATGSGQYVDEHGYITSYAVTTKLTEAITIIALWKPDAYRVELDNQGATAAGTLAYYTQYQIGVYSNEACTNAIDKISNVPTKNGYIFAGYFTEKNGNGKQIITADGTIDKTESMKYTDDATLYAFWVKVSTITLYENEAEYAGTTSFIVKYQEGTFVDLACTQAIAKITTPQKDGYTFEGYYLGDVQYIDKNGNILDKCKELNGNTTLTAKWSGITYTVRYYDVYGNLIHIETCEYGEYYQAPRCDIEGYDLYAWKNEVVTLGVEEWYRNLTNVDGKNINFTAMYERWFYRIHFDIGFFSMSLNDYKDFSGEMPDMICYWGQTYYLPENQVTRKGYSFLYWQGSDGVIYHPGSRIENLADYGDGITLTMVWEKN